MEGSVMLKKISLLLLFILVGNQADSAEYMLCVGQREVANSVYGLIQNSNKPCWQRVGRNEVVYRGDLLELNNTFKFVYAFSFSESEGFDPIVSVTYKAKKRNDNESISGRIEIARERMKTFCSGDKFYKEIRKSVSGQAYNSYHSGKSLEGGVLNDFHIDFKNELKACVSTASRKLGLRKTFSIEDVDYVSQNVVVALLSEFGWVPPARAAIGEGASKYRSVRVEISKGNFRGAALSSSFSVPSEDSGDVIVQDLSSQRGTLGIFPKYRFEIVDR
jgi:hypothetical protein